jgi:hypothetical protein
MDSYQHCAVGAIMVPLDCHIKRGDMVMVVRGQPCCGKGSSFGKVFVADDIEFWPHSASCVFCNTLVNPDGVLVAYEKHADRGYAVYRLKKISPPALDETINERDEVTP